MWHCHIAHRWQVTCGTAGTLRRATVGWGSVPRTQPGLQTSCGPSFQTLWEVSGAGGGTCVPGSHRVCQSVSLYKYQTDWNESLSQSLEIVKTEYFTSKLHGELSRPIKTFYLRYKILPWSICHCNKTYYSDLTIITVTAITMAAAELHLL